MNDNYYLKIGKNELFGEDITNLDSEDSSVKKKAEASVLDRLKETRVRVGTSLTVYAGYRKNLCEMGRKANATKPRTS